MHERGSEGSRPEEWRSAAGAGAGALLDALHSADVAAAARGNGVALGRQRARRGGAGEVREGRAGPRGGGITRARNPPPHPPPRPHCLPSHPPSFLAGERGSAPPRTPTRRCQSAGRGGAGKGRRRGLLSPVRGHSSAPRPPPPAPPSLLQGGGASPARVRWSWGGALKLSGSRLRLGYRTIQKVPGVTVTLNSRPLSRRSESPTSACRQATWQHRAAAQVTELRKLTGSKNSLTKTFIVDLCKRSPTAF